MADTSTDERRTPPDPDGPGAAAKANTAAESPTGEVPAVDGDDGAVEAPVIGCPRCEARVVMGSRYCPSCGTPLVRSGEQAATALSRTRRRAPVLVRVGVPLLLLAVLYAVWTVANHDSSAHDQDVLERRLSDVVAAHRTLSGRLEALTPTAGSASALSAARSTLTTVEAAQDATDADGTASGATGRTTRLRNALTADRSYVAAVVSVLRDPRSPVLPQLGRRSARAVTGLRSVDDIVPTADAIRGTRALGAYARGKRSGASSSSAKRTTRTSSPFVTAVESAVRTGARTRPDISRGFALLRAARDGVSTWDGGARPPADAAAAVAEAKRLFATVATQRAASASRARAIATRQANQRAIVAGLGTAYDAGAATARKIVGCIASFRNTGPQGIASQCLTGVRPLSATEARTALAFKASYAPARRAAGLSGPAGDL